MPGCYECSAVETFEIPLSEEGTPPADVCSTDIDGTELTSGAAARLTFERALVLCGEHDVEASFNLSLFDPDTTREQIAESVALARRELGTPWTHPRTEAHSGTPLAARLRAEGRLHGDEAHALLARAQADAVDPLGRALSVVARVERLDVA